MPLSPLSLPKLDRSQLDIRPIDWSGLNRRYMNDGELEVLVALARSIAPKVMIEIGVNEGRTAKALLANVPTLTRYVGVDVLPGYVPAREVQRREVPAAPGHLARDDDRFELVLKRRGSLDLTIDDLPPADVIFIDGDHGFEAVLHDTLLARRRVRHGGLIVWHDYHGLDTVDVRKVLERFAADGDPIQHIDNTWLAVERF